MAQAYALRKLIKRCAKCGRPAAAPGGCGCAEPLAPGTILAGRYLIVRPVGRGAAATVYHALDRMLDEPVALKVLDAPGAATGDRFRAEIKLARRVTHANVCRIHDYGEDGDRRFICMELIEGRNLRDALAAQGPLGAAEACVIALQAAAALEAIHERGIVHRDVKPANLLQDASGRVYVTDFGVATGGGPGTAGLAAGYVAGTPEYMSPEQAQGLRLDPRSDLYALGVVLYEMLTGQVPFRGASTAETLVRQVQEPLPLGALAAVGVPDDLRRLVERLLAKSREGRPPSAGALAAALRPLALTAAHAIDTPAAARTTVASKTLTLRRMPAALVARVAVAAAALAVASGLRYEFPPRPAPQAALSAEARGAAPPSAVAVPSRSRPRVRTPARLAAATRPTSSIVRAAAVLDVPGPESYDAGETLATQPVTEAAVPDLPPPVGLLRLGIVPWAEVAVDGVSLGTTPLAPVTLPPGTYTARVVHPDFRPFVRKVTIRPGETTPLNVDLRQDGIRNR